jgi:2-aminoethylphosphonate-pyruvate transaminase
MLGGSGTTALEAMLSSLLPRDSRLLVLENGVYGERLSRLAAIHGIAHEALAHEWLHAWDLQRVAEKLASGKFSHVAAVHHETTSGRLNPAQDLAGLCEQFGQGLLLDTVSSFAAEAIPFESPALLACAATANKCLHGITGLCLVTVRRSALLQLFATASDMNLALWAQHQTGQPRSRRRSTVCWPGASACR